MYDGARFTNYNQQNGLANELVNDVMEISPDSLLVATNAPVLYTLVHGKIGRYSTLDHFYPVINRFLRSKDGSLYVTADDGLFKLVQDKFVRLPFLDANGTDLGHNLDKITEWKNYFLIIPWSSGSLEKLLIYEKETHITTSVFKERNIFSAEVSPDGQLWLSTSEGIEILDSFSVEKGIIKIHPLETLSDENQLKNVNIYFDDAGNTWLYGYDKIKYISTTGQEQVISADQGLKTSYLSDVLVDREGITWMASDGNGVVKMSGMNFQVLTELKSGIASNISCLQKQSDTIWLFNLSDNSFYRIHKNNMVSFLLSKVDEKIVSIYIRGASLYFTDRKSLYRIADKDLPSSYTHPELVSCDNGRVKEFGSGIGDPYGAIIQNVELNDTSFYLAVLHHLKIKTQYKISFMCDQMAIDTQGRLWVPTRDNHLLVFTLHPEDPAHYLQLQNDYSTEIEGIGPRSIAVDKKGNVWIGTRYQGIFRFEMEGEKLHSTLQLTTQQGLTDNFNYYLYSDPWDNIWAGSQTGLDKISFINGECIIDNTTKGQNIFLGIHKIINVQDDVIWALTSTGSRIMITTDTSTQKTYTPSLFVTYLGVNDREYEPAVTAFAYDHNNFTIRVAATSYTDEKSILYSYRLKGSVNSKWSEPTHNAVFNFINLAPGKYELNVKADFPSSQHKAQTLQYSFTIRPPYWLTWWFIVIASLIVLAIAVFLVRYFFARKLEKQRMILERKQAIEKERTRIATDMHDDLGAGLSRIRFLSETIGLKQQQHLPIEEEITSIRHYSHEMIDKMGEIVWALNEKNDSLSDLLSYTRAYAMEYLAENGLQSQIDKLPAHRTMMVNSEFRRNIYLSVKESLHNVIKHAKANQVTIQFNITDQLVITIQDDGVGFDHDKIKAYGNGLNNIKKRMTEIGGDLQVLRDHGTCIILTTPFPS